MSSGGVGSGAAAGAGAGAGGGALAALRLGAKIERPTVPTKCVTDSLPKFDCVFGV